MRHLPIVLVALVLVALGCGHAPGKTQLLMSAVRTYNDGLRWQRYAVAATHVPLRERDLFLDERADLHENLRISGYEVTRVSQGDSGARAVVHVKYTWHLDNRGVVHDTTTRQLWERRGQRWWLAEESRVRGPKMPGVPEPSRCASAKERSKSRSGSRNRAAGAETRPGNGRAARRQTDVH